MDSKNLSKKIVRIEYPGIVKNVDNMLATLGGINAVSEVNKLFVKHRCFVELKSSQI